MALPLPFPTCFLNTTKCIRFPEGFTINIQLTCTPGLLVVYMAIPKATCPYAGPARAPNSCALRYFKLDLASANSCVRALVRLLQTSYHALDVVRGFFCPGLGSGSREASLQRSQGRKALATTLLVLMFCLGSSLPCGY